MGANIKIATPISHLFENDIFGSQIIELSDCLECRDHSVDNGFSRQELFHSDLQVIHRFSNEDFNYLKEIKSNKKDLKLISFHLASCYENPLIRKGIFYPQGDKLSITEMKNNAAENIKQIKDIFGDQIHISVENNNGYKTEAYDYVTEADFIHSIVEENNINFLFDISHAKISAINKGVNDDVYISNLPLNRVNQIHISKEDFNSKGEVFDAHELPSDEETKEIIKFIKKYKTLKYITVEYYKDPFTLLNYLRRLKEII